MATRFKHWFYFRGLLIWSCYIKNADPDKYLYSDYGIGFDTREQYSLPDGSVSKKCIIFGVYMSSSVYIDNKGKDIIIFGK